jgi:hypothetical protein
MFRRRASDRAGEWVQLLESKGSPRAVVGRFFPGKNGRPVREVATLATLRTRNGKIKFVPLPWRLRGAESTDPLWVEWDTRAKRSVIVNSFTGRRVADGPPRPNARTALGLDSVRRVGGGFRVGGIEVTGEERDRHFRLAWYRRPAKGSRWRRHSFPLTAGYCRPFLPPALRGLALDPDRVTDVALWKDGSLIFRFAASSPIHPEQLHFCGIARQPQHGQAQLLAWAVYHSYDAPPAFQYQGSPRLGERRWSEDEKGRIRSQPGSGSGWLNDFHFDTDFANGDVIFLLGDSNRSRG